ncbi:TPA: hypothetical protein EYP84_05275 [Candidatus Bipolaricaulota bacterium]|nr:hypothetical protein [Candidatus Bipolaricaulota bacterium]
MNTSRRWLTGAGIATVAISAALFLGGIGYAHWGAEEAHSGPMGPGMWALDCPMREYGVARGGPQALGPVEMSSPTGEAPSLAMARAIAQDYLTRYGDSLEIAEILEFTDNFYVQVKERDSDRFALELLVTRDGRAIPEPGPNMRWNVRYAGMGVRHYRSTGEEMPISPDAAVSLAQTYLDRTMPGATADPEVAAFYGYYTLHILRDGRIAGVLSVNGFTGRVWVHAWHGEFVGREEL